MRSLNNMPIRRKLKLIITLTTTVALLLACAGFLAYDRLTFRRDLTNVHVTLAEVIGANSTAAVIFNDAKAAERTLAALRIQPHIVAACIFTADRKAFATYRRTADARWLPPKPLADGAFVDGDYLVLYRPIVRGGERIGTLYMQSDMLEIQERFQRYAIIVAAVLLLSSFVALGLSTWLSRFVSDPILRLVQSVKEVSQNKNYEVRAFKSPTASHEVGTLIDAFNEMLSQIHSRDQALQESEERFRQIAENVREVFWMSTADWTKVLYLSPAYEQVWGRPCASVYADPLSWMQAIHPDDHARVQNAVERSSQGEAYGIEYRITRADGATRWIRDRGFPIRDESGRLCRVVGIAEDITERKQAQTEMETMHRQLLDASRLAGMAEVATNVLHNVGNVLNSVNVSAALVSEKVHKSKVPNLAKAAAMMHEHENDLAGFLTRDPKGKQLVSYFGTLAQHLGAEQVEILKELESLNHNIEHIKEVVTMQQNYASASGIVDTLPIVDLVEDALRMNDGALVRHEVQVVREYTATPSVPVDKHKVLQILVNLVRNAKYALDDAGRKDKRLTVRVATNGDGFVKVSVIDNGVGIAPDHLTRIFAHGFTTRKNGHGFGLHSGALAAKELGGSLRVHSDGPGHGAAFTLSLPLHKEKDQP